MRRALLAGISEYPVCPAPTCERDASRISNILARHYDNRRNFDCICNLSSKHPITRNFLRESLVRLFSDPADTALFCFSGHGISTSTGGTLVTVDFSKNDWGVPVPELVEYARAASERIREIFIILDCCHNGTIGSPWTAPEVGSIPQGVSILTASASNQQAMEVADVGLFAGLVADALEGGAADVLGNVTAPRVYAYLDQTLGAWEQRPHFKANLSKLETVRECEPAIAVDTLRKLPAIFSNPDLDYPLSPDFEPTSPPKDEGKESIFFTLQKYRAARLLIPVGEDHLYYAAMNRKACRLTPLGRFYWKLVKSGKL